MNDRQASILTSASATYAAMMAANAAEETAPQDSVYGMLADALRTTLRLFYGADDAPAVRKDAANYADAAYSLTIMSGELSAETVALTEAETKGERTMIITADALRHGDIMVDPIGQLRVCYPSVGADGYVRATLVALDESYAAQCALNADSNVRVLCG